MNSDQAKSSLQFLNSRLPIISAHSGVIWPSYHAQCIGKMFIQCIEHCHSIIEAEIPEEIKQEAINTIILYVEQLEKFNKLNRFIKFNS
jgi:hypothetical protein